MLIRIPDRMTADLCELMECRHDSPRRIAMDILRTGLRRRMKRHSKKETP